MVRQAGSSCKPSFRTVDSPPYPRANTEDNFTCQTSKDPPIQGYTMLQLWKKRTFSEKLLELGKWKREHPYTSSRGCSRLSVNAPTINGLPVISQLSNTTKTACVSGKLNDHQVQILLDSGAFCSVMQAGHTPQINLVQSP